MLDPSAGRSPSIVMHLVNIPDLGKEQESRTIDSGIAGGGINHAECHLRMAQFGGDVLNGKHMILTYYSARDYS